MAAITEVTDKAGVEVKSLNLIDASRYSTHTNAFFIGFGRFKSIYLYDTLLKNHEPEEVAAIFKISKRTALRWEKGPAKNRDEPDP